MPKTNVDLPQSIYRDLNDLIRGELKRRHQSQGSLAVYLNMSRPTLQHRLSGEKDWTVPEILNLLEFFGFDIKELLKILKKGVRT